MSKNNDKIKALTVTLLALLLEDMQADTTTPVEEPSAPETEPAPAPKPKGKGKPTPVEAIGADEPEDAPAGEEITLATLREQAQGLMTDGKAAEIKKILKDKGGKAESLTKLDEKFYPAVKAAFDALAIG